MTVASQPALLGTHSNSQPFHQRIGEDRSFFYGRVNTLSTEAVLSLHAAFEASLEKNVEAALASLAVHPEVELPTDIEPVRAAAIKYAQACSRTRTKYSPATIAEAISGGLEQMSRETKKLLQAQESLDGNVSKRLDELRSSGRLQTLKKKKDIPVAKSPGLAEMTESISVAFKAMVHKVDSDKSFSKKIPPLPAQLADLPWDENDRIYMKLDDQSQSPIEPVITERLNAEGYQVTDYVNNRAVDNRKNERKIGKLIKDNEGLLAAYFNDPSRASKDLMIVFTRNVQDIARGSIERGWQSCRADPSTAARYAAEEANIGVVSAYLVHINDPGIHNPLARINLKPYDKINGKHDGWDIAVNNRDTIYAPFNPIGLHHPGFVDAVYRFADALNAGKTGWYKLRSECESYREFEKRRLLPRDAKAALKELGVPYTMDAHGGNITVHGDLSLSEFGLTRLPDFRDVTVLGKIDVSANRLLTLEGLPRQWAKSVTADKNLLVCLAGAPEIIDETLSYRDNAWLMSTVGAPRATEFQYGNGHNDHRNYGTSERPISPIEEPKRFPGFKR